MLTVASIPAATAAGYADYLQSRTVTPEQGDYYLGADGAPAEAPGRWLTPPEVLAQIGVYGPPEVAGDDLRALMAGRAPGSGAWLRPAGADGARAGGIDITFSAPKSVSIAWALADPGQRTAIETAHHAAVDAALGHLRANVALTVRYDRALRRSVPAFAREVHAAAFLHTTARGAAGEVPDPQLHSHVVITSVERADGTIAAVRSRPLFRAAREGGAYYRAHLAHELTAQRYAIEQAGKDERYFRLLGVPEKVERAFSKRTEEVHRAAQAFRAQHGRAPVRGELRALAVQTRATKTLITRGELDETWRDVAREHGQETVVPAHDPAPAPGSTKWGAAVERQLTRSRATFDERELRTVAFEQAPGRGLSPHDALHAADDLRGEDTVLTLDSGLLTTRRVRELEHQIENGISRMARTPSREIDTVARENAIAQTAERLGHPLSDEQRGAVTRLTSPGRAAVLVGPAGTGKGVVIDAAARAEQRAGREVIGVAVAGRTAQRLGEDSPALAGRTRTINSLLNATKNGTAALNENTTVYVDEAGMGDTERLAHLVRTVEQSGASIVAVGDHRQLPSVGAGGMFKRLTDIAPTATLSEVRRARDPADRQAWDALRNGDPATAMAHYRARGQLHFSEDRVAAVNQAATRYTQLAREHSHHQVALMTDASNAEVDALNLRVQNLRGAELGERLADLGSGHAIHQGDRVVLTRTIHQPDQPRVENGARGIAVSGERDTIEIKLDGSNRVVTLNTEDTDALRLGYASHVYRQQGATVDRAVVVTGGWQTARETAYVQASRARGGVDWHVSREDLDAGSDADRVDALAARMRTSNAQLPSLDHDLAIDAPISEEVAPTPVLEIGV